MEAEAPIICKPALPNPNGAGRDTPCLPNHTSPELDVPHRAKLTLASADILAI